MGLKPTLGRLQIIRASSGSTNYLFYDDLNILERTNILVETIFLERGNTFTVNYLQMENKKKVCIMPI